MDIEFGKSNEQMAIPLSVLIIDNGFCENCSEHHGYTLEIMFFMLYLRVDFDFDNHGMNEDRIG